MTCEGFINPLDLQCVLVNTLSGSWTIYAILSLVVIVIVAAKFRMPNTAIGASILIYAIFFYDQMPWLLYISSLMAAIIVGIIVSNMVKR